MSDVAVNSEITTGQRLAAIHGDCRNEVIAEATKRSEITRMLASEYDPSKYAWRSEGHVGNTLPEIEEIRAYGHPLSKSRTATSGEMHFRGYQYEGDEGFLKGSKQYVETKVEDVEGYSALDFLYAEPLPVQERTLLDAGYSEVVHATHGKGYLLEVRNDLSRVYFMQLPGSTPSCHHGANIRWVKNGKLL